MMNAEIQPPTPWHLNPHIFYSRGDAGAPNRGAPAGAARRAGPSAAEGMEANRQQIIVLIAEDEETIAETLAMIVEDAGYAPLIAHDGREALALARERHPHLILTDLMMPYLNGADLIAAVRRHAAAEGYASPPIVLVTAAGRARAEQAGADVVIPKPFDVDKIEAILQSMIAERPE